MSLIPLLYRDWWEDFDRPSRLFDQNFGLGLNRDDLLSSMLSRPLLRQGYVRPWRDSYNRQNSGSSTLQVDKDKFQVGIWELQFYAVRMFTFSQSSLGLRIIQNRAKNLFFYAVTKPKVINGIPNFPITIVPFSCSLHQVFNVNRNVLRSDVSYSYP